MEDIVLQSLSNKKKTFISLAKNREREKIDFLRSIFTNTLYSSAIQLNAL